MHELTGQRGQRYLKEGTNNGSRLEMNENRILQAEERRKDRAHRHS